MEKIREAIEQTRADLSDLEQCLPGWQNHNTTASKTYRAIARRIIASAQRIKELVTENTYHYP